MQALLPVAGAGTRLKPHTHTVPKALVKVAGKPILEHIVDALIEFGVDRFVFIVGYLGDKIKEHLIKNYVGYEMKFVEQKERKGLGHAVYLAKDYIDEDMIIIYGDTIFEANLKDALKQGYDAVIGVKMVDDPRKYGVVEMSGDLIVKLVEKPDYIKRMPAIVGINYIHNYKALFEALDHIIKNDIKTKGEYQLTDAFQVMVDKGHKLTTFNVPAWFDCGKPETLLETNRYLLSKNGNNVESELKNSIVIAPSYVGKNCKIKNSIIGPYTTIGDNVTIENCIIKSSIVNDDAIIKSAVLENSLIGSHVYYEEGAKSINIGDDSKINLSEK